MDSMIVAEGGTIRRGVLIRFGPGQGGIMRGNMRVAVVFAIAVLIGEGANAGRIDMYVVAGQSNQVAYAAPASALPPNLQAPQTDIVFRPTSGMVTTLQPQDDRFGPEMSFARVVADAHAKAGLPPIGIMKYAVGSTNLAVDWYAGENGADPNIGPRYRNMMARAQSTAAYLRTQGHDPHWAGLLWLQGEADANIKFLADAYDDNLRLFIERVRADLSSPALPVVIAEINAPYRQYRDDVRAAQELAAATMPGVFLFDTIDLALADKVHYTPTGVLKIGSRYAEKFVSLGSSGGSAKLAAPEPGAFVLFGLAVTIAAAARAPRACRFKATRPARPA